MQKKTAYHIGLIFIFLIVWIWAAVNPVFRHDWLLENYLVFIAVPIIIITGYYFRLSNISYTLITIFMVLHLIGSHYSYAKVPFGYILQSWLGSERNMYDRLVHFSFGFLLAYPLREIFVRVTKAKGFWGYWFPFEITLAFSAVYEIIEWITAANVDPASGLAFLGVQGDIWDTQKDMFVAGIGALITMIITMSVNIFLEKGFKEEFLDSLKPSKQDAPLGEEKLKRMISK